MTADHPLAGVGAAGWDLAETYYTGTAATPIWKVTKTEEWVHPASRTVAEIGYTRDGDMVAFELVLGDAEAPGLAAAIMTAVDGR